MRKILPAKAIDPRIKSVSENLDIINIVTSIIGRSVISGDAATFMPAFEPCLSVSEITRANNGPGINPVKPRKNPVVTYVSPVAIFTVIYHGFMTSAIIKKGI